MLLLGKNKLRRDFPVDFPGLEGWFGIAPPGSFNGPGLIEYLSA